MSENRMERSYGVDPGEEVFLSNQIFGETWCNELKEIDKHEIIIRICDILGSCPSNLHLAEEIFDAIKFDITRYIIHHEYCRCNSVRSKLLLWLDSRINPAKAAKLSKFINKYLK